MAKTSQSSKAHLTKASKQQKTRAAAPTKGTSPTKRGPGRPKNATPPIARQESRRIVARKGIAIPGSRFMPIRVPTMGLAETLLTVSDPLARQVVSASPAKRQMIEVILAADI